MIPQTQEIDSNVEVSKEKIGSNVLDAISNGTALINALKVVPIGIIIDNRALGNLAAKLVIPNILKEIV
ncbi:hypothetical protein N9K77_00880 [bacterium]|nr:hypothetical protein [bacterium]